jgi:hypothetical protein
MVWVRGSIDEEVSHQWVVVHYHITRMGRGFQGRQAAKPNKKTLVKRAIGAGLTLPSQAWCRIRRQPRRG